MLKFLLKLFVSLSLLAILVAHIDLEASWRVLEHLVWSDVIAATTILTGLIPVLAWRWRRIAKFIGVPLRQREALLIAGIGIFFNQVLPSAIGGDLIRLWILKNAHVPVAKGLFSIFIDRVVALFGMMLIVAIGFPWLMEIVRVPLLQSAAAIAIASGFAGTAALLFLDKLPLPKVLSARQIVTKMLSIGVDARAVFLTPKVIVPALSASMLIHLFVSISVWILAQGIGIDVQLKVFILLLPVVLILSFLPISIAGWGVREGTMIACLALAGVDSTSAFAISALFGACQFLSGLPGGLIWLLSGSKVLRKRPTPD